MFNIYCFNCLHGNVKIWLRRERERERERERDDIYTNFLSQKTDISISRSLIYEHWINGREDKALLHIQNYLTYTYTYKFEWKEFINVS